MTVSNLSPYAEMIMQDAPVGYWRMCEPHLLSELDMTPHGNHGAYHGGCIRTMLPNGDIGTVTDGFTGFLEIPDSDLFSINTSKLLTVECWTRPDTTNHPKNDGTKYVNFFGKGTPNQHEWTWRVYNEINDEVPPRPWRISGYAFNLSGNLGSGSYFEDQIKPGEWMHIGLVIDMRQSPAYPTGFTKIYKNGVMRKQVALASHNVIPDNGTAPVRIGTREGGIKSHFVGAFGHAAIYDYALSAESMVQRYEEMMG
jgi:hypothetical protein